MSQELASKNPATGKVISTLPLSSKEEVEVAFKVARNALQGWAETPFEKRLAILEKYSSLLLKQKEKVATLISQENGKPLWESKTEVDTMLNKVPISHEAYLKRCEERKKGSVVCRHKPWGVVGVLGPFNFPGHLPTGHIIPALLAGNTVVFKPSELTPLVGKEVVNLLYEAGLPEGVLQLLIGGKEVGEQLAYHPEINALYFTGSYATGKALSSHFGAYPEKILALEMGGNNPLVIGQIHDYQAAALLTIQSAYLTSGQRCTCARRLIFSSPTQVEPFLKAFTPLITSLKVGAFDESPEPFMGPLISPEAAKHALQGQEKLVKLGGKLLAPMRLLKEHLSFLTPGLIDMTGVKQKPDEEIFAPLLQLIVTNSLKEAMEEANRTQYGLSAAIFSDSEEEYQQFLRTVRAGLINWNAPTTGASGEQPFGGVGWSGNGRPSAFYAVDYCSYPVASTEMVKLAPPAKPLPGVKTP